jgi:hypothetical protein
MVAENSNITIIYGTTIRLKTEATFSDLKTSMLGSVYGL